MELSNQDSQVSQNSSESRLSIITSEDNTKMEIREDSDSKLLKSSDSNSQMEIYPLKPQTTLDVVKSEVEKVDESDSSSDNNVFDEKNIKKREDEKEADKINDVKKKVVDEKQSEDKKYNDRKLDDKKSKSSDKYNYKDKKDDKYRKNSGNSSRDKEKSSSKYSSSSSSKDKTKNKDKKDSRNNCSSSKDKDKQEKDSYKNERDKDKIKNEKDKCERERDRDRKDKDKSEKDKVDKSKLVKEKEKSVKDKDKGKSCNSSSSSSSSKHNNNKEKDKSSTSVKSDSSKKDKEKSRSSSSSSSKDNKSKSSYSDSKSKSSSSDKHKKDDKSSVKHSNSSSSSKKDKDKKKNSKKDDDHYSSKDKKNDRRSTDRDSNDGRSSKPGQINSFPEGQSSQTQKSNQESSNSNSGSGSGDSGNSDQNEHINKSPFKVTEHSDNKEPPITYLDTQKFKYTKPKFASNFQEARKLMKIRKQLAKLERHNQLSLAQIEVPTEITIVNGINCAENDSDGEQRNVGNIKEIEDFFEQSKTPEVNEGGICAKDKSLFLQSRELSKENWEALEARLAQEMSNINCNSYESYDDYDYGGYNSAGVSPIKTSLDASEKCATEENVEKIVDSESNQSQQREVEDVTEKCILPQIHTESKWEEGSNNVIEEIGKNNALSILSDVESLSLKDNSETTENYSEEGMTDVQEGVTENKPTDTGESEVFKTDLDEGVTKMAVDTEDKVNNVDFTLHSDSDSSEPCIYLEPLSPRLDKNLQFLYKYIETLEQDVKHSLKTFQNNFVPLKERYRKRKLVENVDLRNNNNKAHYEQTTGMYIYHEILLFLYIVLYFKT